MFLTALLLSLSSHGATFAHDHDHPHHHDQESSWPKPAVSAEPVYVGKGEHRYRWDSTWMKLPAGREWLGSTHGCLVTDRENRLYVSAESGPAILVFAPDGKLERSFGDDWGSGVHGLTIVKEGETEVLYLAHTNKREVWKTNLDGKILQRFEAPPADAKLYETPEQYKPTSVAVAPNGTVFVADGYGLSWIHRYNAKGEYLDSFGGAGEGPEHLRTPHGLWLDTLSEEPTLLVADRENHRLVRFDLKGEFLAQTDPKSGLLRRPCHVQFLGKLGVVSDLAGRTTLVDENLGLVAHLGDNDKENERANYGVTPDLWREGAFLAPHCARFNSKGEIFVMDWNVAGRLTRLVPAPE